MENVATKLRAFWSDPERKPLLQIGYELAHAAWQERELPMHYFSRCLYRRSVGNPLDYSGNRRINRLHRAMTSASDNQMLDDKLFFQLLFGQAGIRVPRLLGYNCGATYHDGVAISIANIESFEQVVRATLAKTTEGCIFVKLRHGTHGDGAIRITAETLEDNLRMQTIHQSLIRNSCVFQETLSQHPAISAIYPHCINTVRMDTFVHDDGRVEPLSAFMRFGSDGRYVDNSCAGGCFVGIDFQTGRLKTKGNRLLEFGGHTLEAHPFSGVRFEGIQVPHFEEAKALVTRAAAVTPTNRLVGWDVAIQADGPTLIEGNTWYHMGGQEIAYGGYRRHPTFAKILDQFTGARR
ncbi:sugar-transfer associated ATP-grasp domain-containing protein [Geothrix sp. PMB-07]|uniref:sugar-transfer associated ATP-grasp domain-containing protein n=1 Tax=Geothrix sp. PMB-07 TaxID=3068640 RepID=UPI002741D90E|nr:sugar-transfer associated ATP-grasp domain-containing protein [Geothrix sp. PMB-07]WLT32386.1 sugar-transfer associated ATP-grasp domain-containing protein [Geothrix sp. PMB-07]